MTFDINSTAAEVLDGIDLSGKLVLVTGGYSGLGLATTRALANAGAGAGVVVPARRPEHAEKELSDVEGVEVDELDLSSLDSVAGFARRFLATGRTIDILIANAGIMACPETRVGDGWEAQFAVNHLGHYALVNQVWPALVRSRSARVVVVSSGISQAVGINWDDVKFTAGYDKWQAYGQSKRANVLFAEYLDRAGRSAGLHAYAVNPGYILTPLQRHLSKAEMMEAGWIDADGNPLLPEFKAPEQGAATAVWAATAPELAEHGGAYCQACALVETEYSGEEADRLWALSAELTGVNALA